jgi:hypothetical protein
MPAKHDVPETSSPAEELRGRLVLATGRVVCVPAEGCQIATHHYDDELGSTVPVTAAFVVSD